MAEDIFHFPSFFITKLMWDHVASIWSTEKISKIIYSTINPSGPNILLGTKKFRVRMDKSAPGTKWPFVLVRCHRQMAGRGMIRLASAGSVMIICRQTQAA